MPLVKADSDIALRFVVERISEEAERSAAALDDDEKDFLNNLPAEPTNPTITDGFNATYEFTWPTPVLRDLRFERLCNMARNAYAHDLQTRLEAAREWKFAGAVLEFHHHPMSWLLGWAGIRTSKRPLWDRILLIATATFVVLLFVVGAIGLSIFTNRQTEVWKWTLWILCGSVYAALMILLYFAVRRLDRWQREQYIERYRCDLPRRSSTCANR